MKINKHSIILFFSITILGFFMINCAGSYKKATPEDMAPYQEIRVIKGTKDDLFFRTKKWMAETFQSSKAVIELENKNKEKIIENARILVKGVFGTTIYFDMSIIIDIRDGKIRFTAKNFSESHPDVDGFKTDNAYQWQELKHKIRNMFNDLILFIKTDRENDKW